MSRMHHTVERVCAVCGKPFTTDVPNRVYCSNACYVAAKAVAKKKAKERRKVDMVCPVCGASFTDYESRRFCSVACRKKYWNMRRNTDEEAYRDLHKKVCANCGKAYVAKNVRSQYCSYKCERDAYHKRMKAQRAAKRERNRAIREAAAAQAKAIEAEKKRQHFNRVMKDVLTPIKDDEPLSRYV